MVNNKTVLIGAGLSGPLMATYLTMHGYNVDIYEKRSDMRLNNISAGRSINLALSIRGIRALKEIGLYNEIKSLMIPMKGRMIHDLNGETNLQPYGKNNKEVIYSISRAELNKKLITASENTGKVQIFFEHELTNAVDQANKILKNRFDFKDADAEFNLNDNSIVLTAKEDFHIKQMNGVLQDAVTKRNLDIRILKYEKIEITNNTAKQIATLQEGIDRDLAKNISALIKKSKLKVQSSIQGDSVRVTGKKRDDLQEVIQFIKEQKYSIPLQFDNFRD